MTNERAPLSPFALGASRATSGVDNQGQPANLKSTAAAAVAAAGGGKRKGEAAGERGRGRGGAGGEEGQKKEKQEEEERAEAGEAAKKTKTERATADVTSTKKKRSTRSSTIDNLNNHLGTETTPRPLPCHQPPVPSAVERLSTPDKARTLNQEHNQTKQRNASPLQPPHNSCLLYTSPSPRD